MLWLPVIESNWSLEPLPATPDRSSTLPISHPCKSFQTWPESSGEDPDLTHPPVCSSLKYFSESIYGLSTYGSSVPPYQTTQKGRKSKWNEWDGICTTKPGGLAVVCPVCPQPDVNLPNDWREVEASKRWVQQIKYHSYTIMPHRFLYLLFIAIDVNFRLKNCAHSSDDLDPGLHTGLAYFVSNHPYYDHVLQYAMQDNVRLHTIYYWWCSDHDHHTRLAHAAVSSPWPMLKQNLQLVFTQQG